MSTIRCSLTIVWERITITKTDQQHVARLKSFSIKSFGKFKLFFFSLRHLDYRQALYSLLCVCWVNKIVKPLNSLNSFRQVEITFFCVSTCSHCNSCNSINKLYTASLRARVLLTVRSKIQIEIKKRDNHHLVCCNLFDFAVYMLDDFYEGRKCLVSAIDVTNF